MNGTTRESLTSTTLVVSQASVQKIPALQACWGLLEGLTGVMTKSTCISKIFLGEVPHQE